MIEKDKLNVFLDIEETKLKLGTLVYKDKAIYFKLSEEYLSVFSPLTEQRLLLSPYKMKHSREIQTTEYNPFDGLFGLFADSLPDAWGKLLLDRFLKSKRKENTLDNPLARLSYVGTSGFGALRYEPYDEVSETANFSPDLDLFNEESKKIIIGEESTVIDNFYRLGGTSGGARPKINIGYNVQTKEIVQFQEQLPQDFEPWMVKFPSQYDLPDISHIEYAYHELAKKCGIEVTEATLLKSGENKFFFATKRFDRNKNKRFHVHSLAGLLHDNFTQSSLDYGHLIDVAFFLEKDIGVYEQLFRRLIFNIIFCNQDDHSKNFSFLMTQQGKWRLAPAYDLTFSPSVYNFHSLSVAGNYHNVTMKNVQDLANHFEFKGIDLLIDELITVSSEWRKIAAEAGVSENSVKEIESKIHQKIK